MEAEHLPPRDSGAWWAAYVERMGTDREFQKKVYEVVAERHMEAAYLVASDVRRCRVRPSVAHRHRRRLYENERARERHPSPDPFEDGWRPSGAPDIISALTAKAGI